MAIPVESEGGMRTVSEKVGKPQAEQRRTIKRRSSATIETKPAKLTKAERAILHSLPARMWWEEV